MAPAEIGAGSGRPAGAGSGLAPASRPAKPEPNRSLAPAGRSTKKFADPPKFVGQLLQIFASFRNPEFRRKLRPNRPILGRFPTSREGAGNWLQNGRFGRGLRREYALLKFAKIRRGLPTKFRGFG